MVTRTPGAFSTRAGELPMMGRNHVVSGAIVGVLTLPLVDLPSIVLEVGWVVLVAGAVLIPDWDSHSSSASRMWGPLSGAVHAIVSAISGGHRWGTHDAIAAPAVVAGLALLARDNQITAGVVIALVVGLMLQGLTTGGVVAIPAPLNLLCSVGAAWLLPAIADDIAALLEVMPAALALGVVVAIAGDFITEEGVPIPIAWIWTRRRIGLGLFRVDGLIENGPVALLLALGLVAAIWCQATGVDPAALIADKFS